MNEKFTQLIAHITDQANKSQWLNVLTLLNEATTIALKELSTYLKSDQPFGDKLAEILGRDENVRQSYAQLRHDESMPFEKCKLNGEET